MHKERLILSQGLQYVSITLFIATVFSHDSVKDMTRLRAKLRLLDSCVMTLRLCSALSLRRMKTLRLNRVKSHHAMLNSG